MPIRTGSRAPYAPPNAVLAVIHGFRDRGLATPFRAEVLLRAGINDSLVPRTLKSLEDLDLVDADGNPTAELEGLRRATTDEFKTRLGEVIRSVYAEVFQFVDPATDDTTKVSDAFRAYDPAGQRVRMVKLFLGLCEAAGIIAAGPRKPTTPNGKPRPTSSPRPFGGPERHRGSSVGSKARVRNDHDHVIPAAITGALGSLPAEGDGWTQQRRDAFLRFFTSALDFVYPVKAEAANKGEEE